MELQVIRSRSSFRRQIILTFVVGFCLLIAAFAVYMVLTERENLHRDNVDETTSMAQSLAVSALPWVLADDVAGLQEVVHAYRGYPDFSYAMVISPKGRVIAHSDPSKTGLYLSDPQSLDMLKSPHTIRIMEDSADRVDVAVPIELGKQQVGWARVSELKTASVASLRTMVRNIIVFLLVSTALSFLAATIIANRLGRHIRTMVRVAEAVQSGNYSTRISVREGEDEIARLGNSLNMMLETLTQNEAALRDATHYTRSLIEASLDPLVTISPEGKITDVNAATEKVTGRSRDELVGADFSEYFTEPDKARAGYKAVFEKGFVTDYPLVLRRKDGHLTDVLYNASLYRDESGKVLGVFAAARDVTERNKAEIAVRKNEALLQAIMKILPVGVWMLDANGQVIFGNDAAQRIWSGVRYVGIEQLGEYKGWWADTGKPVGPHDWAGSRAVEKGEIVTGEEVEIECFDGTRKFILDSAVPLHNDDGSIRGAVTVNLDITERKKAELEREQYFKFFNVSTDLMGIADPNGAFKKVNPAFTEQLGYSRDEILSRPFIEFVHPDDRQSTLNEMERQLKLGYTLDFENRYICKDGSIKWISWRANINYNDGLTYAAGRDITERKQAEEVLRSASLYSRSLIEASLDPLVTISAGGKITDVNAATEKATGLNRNELVGTDFSDYFAEPDKARAGYREVFAQGYVTDYPLTLRHKDGHTSDVLYNASLYRDEAGKVMGVFAAARDVTERKKAEEAVRKSEARLAEAQHMAHIGNWSWDIASDKIFWSPEYYRIYNYDPALPTPSYQDHLAAYTKESAATLDAAVKRAVEFGEPYALELELAKPDVAGRWVYARGEARRDAAGKVSGLYGTSQDITERKMAELKLAQLSLRNRLILDSAGEGIYGLDIAGRCTFANPTALQLLGFSSEELIGQHSHAMFHHTKPDGSPYPVEECPIQSAFKQGVVHRGVDLYWRKDGKSFPVEFISTPITESGSISGAVVTFSDITERKRAQDALQSSEAQLKEAQRIAHVGNWNLDLVSNTLTWSDEIYRIFEIDPEKFGASYEAFLDAIHPEDRDMVNQAYTSSVANRTPYDIVHRLLMKDGRIKYVNEKCETHYAEDGKPLRSVGTVHDITERKRAEDALFEAQEVFRTLVENSPDIITRYDRELRRTYVNPTYLKTAGMQKGALIGSTPAQASPLPPESAAQLLQLLRKVMDTGVVADIDVIWPREDNIDHWYNIFAFPEFDRAGRVASVMTMSREITARKEAEEQVRKLNAELEERVQARTAALEAANKELEAFSYSVSHDLRSPLRAIDGFSNILMEDYAGKLDNEGKRLVGVVRDNAIRMARLIDDILAFSRLGRKELLRQAVDMRQLANETASDLAPAMEGREIRLEIGELPPAHGDASMLRQVWANLLGNAVKFTRKCKVAEISVSGQTEGNELVYCIRDNGAGFDMQYANKLFGVFSRLHSAEEFEGTGAGLAIVKRIITRHGGRVWGEGKVDEGATFWFALPAGDTGDDPAKGG